MEDTTSLINKLKRRGEKLSSWGTPEVTFIGIDIQLLYLIIFVFVGIQTS